MVFRQVKTVCLHGESEVDELSSDWIY